MTKNYKTSILMVMVLLMMDVDDVGSMEASVGVNFFSDGVVGKVVG